MSTHDRPKRPPLDRREPIRRWSTLFAPPTRPAGGEEDGNANGDGHATADVFSRSVDMGYRVLDDWMREGQRAAQRMSDRRWSIDALPYEASDLAARMAQYSSEMLGMWFELMEMATMRGRNGAVDREESRSPSGTTRPEPTGGVGQPAERPRVRINVDATRPVEVTLDLGAAATGQRLIAHALRSAQDEHHRLTEVSITSDPSDESFVIAIRVPDGHPAGVYNGLILDEASSRPVGTLSVRLGDASRTAD